MEWLARGVGAFYVIAGLIVIYASRIEVLMDRMLDALSQFGSEKPNPYEHYATYGGILIALLTLVSGVALVGLSAWALPLFILCSLVQAIYLLLANRFIPPRGPDQALGRKRTTNAFMIYLGATAFVLWLQQDDRLVPWPPSDPLWIAGGAVALVAAYALLIWNARRLSNLQQPPDFSPIELDDTVDGDARPVELDPPLTLEEVHGKLRLAPEQATFPLWHKETGDNIYPFRLPIPEELAMRLDTWDATWQALDMIDPKFATPEEEARYNAEGREILKELEDILGPIDAPAQFR